MSFENLCEEYNLLEELVQERIRRRQLGMSTQDLDMQIQQLENELESP